MDLKTLSKQKYIYRIYESVDKVLHCEKYPVVYINSQVVYYKDGRKKEYLNYTRVLNVKEDFEHFRIGNGSYGDWASFDMMFWNVDEPNIEDIFKDLKEQRNIIRSKQNRDRIESKMKRAKLEYERALKEFESMESNMEQ